MVLCNWCWLSICVFNGLILDLGLLLVSWLSSEGWSWFWVFRLVIMVFWWWVFWLF